MALQEKHVVYDFCRHHNQFCGATWRAVPAEFETGMCEMKSWGLTWFFLGGGQVQDRFAEMRGVAWKAFPVNEAAERDEILSRC